MKKGWLEIFLCRRRLWYLFHCFTEGVSGTCFTCNLARLLLGARAFFQEKKSCFLFSCLESTGVFLIQKNSKKLNITQYFHIQYLPVYEALAKLLVRN